VDINCISITPQIRTVAAINDIRLQVGTLRTSIFLLTMLVAFVITRIVPRSVARCLDTAAAFEFMVNPVENSAECEITD
jgi:hypothetical protein